jgi:hypothetical protein
MLSGYCLSESRRARRIAKSPCSADVIMFCAQESIPADEFDPEMNGFE